MKYIVEIYFYENKRQDKPKFVLTIDKKEQYEEILKNMQNDNEWLIYGPLCCRKNLIKYMVYKENDSDISIKK